MIWRSIGTRNHKTDGLKYSVVEVTPVKIAVLPKNHETLELPVLHHIIHRTPVQHRSTPVFYSVFVPMAVAFIITRFSGLRCCRRPATMLGQDYFSLAPPNRRIFQPRRAHVLAIVVERFSQTRQVVEHPPQAHPVDGETLSPLQLAILKPKVAQLLTPLAGEEDEMVVSSPRKCDDHQLAPRWRANFAVSPCRQAMEKQKLPRHVGS